MQIRCPNCDHMADAPQGWDGGGFVCPACGGAVDARSSFGLTPTSDGRAAGDGVAGMIGAAGSGPGPGPGPGPVPELQVQCPHCGSILHSSGMPPGQIVTCESCGGQMQLPEAGPEPEIRLQPPAPPAPEGLRHSCPYCGEQILETATKCRHCRTYLTGPMAGKSDIRGPRSTGSGNSQNGGKALLLGILGLFVCQPIFGGLAIYYGHQARQEGDGKGTAAMVLGFIDVAIFFLAVLGKMVSG